MTLTSLRRNSVAASAAELTKVGTQAVLLVLLARILTAAPFGQLVGALALFQLVGPFAWLGAGSLLVRSYTIGEAGFSVAFGRAVGAVLVGGTAASALAIFLSPHALPNIGARTIAPLVVAELIFTGVVEVCAMATWAHERIQLSVAIRGAAGLSRLAAVIIGVALPGALTLPVWSLLYAGASCAAALLGIAVCTRAFGPPLPLARPRLEEARRGIAFSTGQTLFAVQDNIDKPLLVRYGFAADAGMYGVAYRIAILGLLPVRAMLQAAHARFFAAGRTGVEGSWSFARRIFPSAIGLAIVSGAGLAAIAPVLPWALGASFEGTRDVLWALAALPLVRTLSYFPGDALTGADRHGRRVRWIAGTAALNVVLNVALVPTWSWRGAIAATYGAEIALVAGLWYSLHKERRIASNPVSTDVLSGATS